MAKAVTARFEADFSSFVSAARAAEGALTKLVQAAGVTEGRVESLSRSFSGTSIIKEALATVQAVENIGGASKLTGAELDRVNRITTQALDKMKLLGIEAAPELQRLADATKRVEPAMAGAAAGTTVLADAIKGLSVYLGPAAIIGAFVSFAKGALDAGDALVKASDKTGITIDALQKLQFIAEQSGNTLDDVTGAISQMQNRLSSDDKSAVAAVDRLGLSLRELKGLEPDQQFVAIAQAIAKIPDPMVRTQLAMDLFGRKGAEILPTMRADIARLAEEAPRMSAAAARGLDDFGDMMSKIWLSLKNVTGEVLAATIDGVRLMVASFGTLADVAGKLLAGNFKDAWNAAMGLSKEALPDVKAAATGAAGAMSSAGTAAGNLADDTKASALAAFEQQQFIDRTNDAIKKHVQEVEKADKAQQAFAGSVKSLSSIYVFLKAALEDAGSALHDLPSEALTTYATNQTKARKEAEQWAQTNGAVLAPSIRSIGTAMQETTKQASLFGGIFQKLGPTIMSAIQGGGDVGKSIGSMIGNSFGTFFANKAAEQTSGFFASKLGGMIGSVIPGVGALAGQLLGAGMQKAMGWIKGLFSDPMKKEIEAAQKEIDKLKAKMLEHGGDLEQIEARYNALGLSVREAWAGQGKQGLEALKAVQDEFNKRLEDSKTKLTDLRGKFKDLQTELDGLIGKANEMGYVFNTQGELIGFNFDRVAQVAKDFGVDLAALGPAFQQAQLTAEAQKVIDAFTLLTMSGADVGGVLVGMKDEINKIVRDSLQFGTVIPANMRPWIEELIRTGQLTDANGQKITNLSQIKFGDPVKSQYEKINDSIQTVLSAMQDLIGQISTLVSAIDAATRPRTLTVTAEYFDPGPPPGFGDPRRGGGNGDGADQERAIGTIGATGSWFENFGSGRLVRLHGQESVIRRDQAAAFAADMGGGADVAAEVAALRGDLNENLPRAIARAMRDALQLSGALA